MSVARRNLINLEKVSKSFGREPILDSVSLGVAEADRIAGGGNEKYAQCAQVGQHAGRKRILSSGA